MGTPLRTPKPNPMYFVYVDGDNLVGVFDDKEPAEHYAKSMNECYPHPTTPRYKVVVSKPKRGKK